MPKLARLLDVHANAISLNRIKSHHVIASLYSDIVLWQDIVFFDKELPNSFRTPRGDAIELRGDPALTVAVANFQDTDVAIIAQHTPDTLGKSSVYNYGLISAHGYWLAIAMMEYAERMQLPLHFYIDTVGGDPFEESASELQSWAIARCQAKLLQIKIPTISVILGQGGSGGAIAFQLTHERLMLSEAMYSVIAPEGCAAILLREVTEKNVEEALSVLQPTVRDMLRYGIVDYSVDEEEITSENYQPITLSNIQTALSNAMSRVHEMDYLQRINNLKEKLYNIGYIVEHKPWYKWKRSVRFPFPRILKRSDAYSSDPHIASIRKHVFGSYDDVPETCNNVKDNQGSIIRYGCGTPSTEKQFQENWYSCPACDRPNAMDPYLYIDLLCDRQHDASSDKQVLFDEKYKEVTVKDIHLNRHFYNYASTRDSAVAICGTKEAMVIGHGKLYSMSVCLAISDFRYMGGSMGAVVGEKFRAIINFAIDNKMPVISITASGGARMQEGTVALMQMGKTVSAVLDLQKADLPFVSILAHPTLGGVLASYATATPDIIIAEKKATISFAGDRVVKLASGGRGVDPNTMTAEFFDYYGGIHIVTPRRDLKKIVASALKLTKWHREMRQ